MSRVQTFIKLPTGDQFRVLLAATLLVLLPTALRLGTFVHVRRVTLWSGQQARRIITCDTRYARVVSAVRAADRHLPGSRKCLARSLVAEALLRAYGHVPNHRIGVAKDDNGEIAAHSWLELDGDVILGDLDDLARFDPLPSLDAIDQV